MVLEKLFQFLISLIKIFLFIIFFWGLLTFACIVWYSTVTIYVVIKCVSDIKHILGRQLLS